jgi:hypothetical protein
MVLCSCKQPKGKMGGPSGVYPEVSWQLLSDSEPEFLQDSTETR